MDDSSSRHSTESVVIHKLGFGTTASTYRALASVMNRVAIVPGVMSIILRIISFIQIIALSTACTCDGVINDTRFSDILKVLLTVFQRFCFNDSSYLVHVVLLCVFVVLLLIWFILYLKFARQYENSRNFSPTLVRVLHFMGTILFPILCLPVASVSCYFVKPLVELDVKQEASLLSFVAIVNFVLYVFVSIIVIQCVQSSPLIDTKDPCCFWPTEPFLAIFRALVLYVYAFFAELLKANSANGSLKVFDVFGAYVICAIGIVVGAIGCYFVVTSHCHILASGQRISFAEYIVMGACGLFSMIHIGSHVLSVYMWACALVVVIICLVVYYRVQQRQLRKMIDILYLPFEETTEAVKSPQHCVQLMKLGLVFAAPCINNQTLQNWALSRWPTDQYLILFCVFLSFVQRAPYMEILDLLSAAVDIKPFDTFVDLLAYQIFVRLPTQENKLKLRLERIRKLYEIPHQSLHHFWTAAIRRHWDETYIHCQQFQEGTTRIFNMFANLIFEHPNYDFVMIEFRRFVEEIQGNIQLAIAVEQEVARRKTEVKASSQQETDSIAQMSRLSSVRSSIFLSEVSENQTPIEKVQSSVFAAVQARPIFTPRRFVFAVNVLVVAAVVLNAILFYFVKSDRSNLKIKTQLAIQFHLLAELSDVIVSRAIEFSSVNDGINVNPGNFNLTQIRGDLSAFTSSLDAAIADAYTCHKAIDVSFMRRWVDGSLSASMLSPEIEQVDTSYIGIMRLMQVRAKTLALESASSFGTLKDPGLEVKHVVLLFPKVTELLSDMTSELRNLVVETDSQMSDFVLTYVYCLFAAGFVIASLLCGILCWSIRREMNFFLDIYSYIPIKVLQKLVEKDNQATIDETDLHISSNMRQKRPPLSAYFIPQVITIFVIAYILLGVPALLLYISHEQHIAQSKIVASGFELSASLVLSTAEVYITAFSLVSGFSLPETTEEQITNILDKLNLVLHTYQTLLYGDGNKLETGMIVSRTNEVSLLLKEPCDVVVKNKDTDVPIKNESCSAFDTDLTFIYAQIYRLLSQDELLSTDLREGWWQLFYPVMNNVITKELSQFREVFISVVTQVRNRANTLDIVAILIFILLMISIPFTSGLLAKYRIKPRFSSILKPIVLMPPEYIAESPFLLRFLQGDFDRPSRSGNHDKQQQHRDKANQLIDFLFEGVLLLSPDGTVVASNKKYHEMMLNSPEEVLGLSIKALFTHPLSAIFDAIDKLREGTTAPYQTISTETSVFTSDDRELQVRISLIAQTKYNGRHYRATSLALILSDRSELTKAQTQLRKEKANVEDLLDSILPHLIAVSMLNGQTDISFTVERASILDANIVGFSTFCRSKPAKQVITTVNAIFTEFDARLSMFSRVTKLKTIGDSYICAAGLFEGDGSVAEATKEIVKMGLTLLEIIPGINQELGVNIQMRIGIHTGGPLVCGVVGRERPLFEVLGDTLAIARELQKKSSQDRIHISSETAELISDLDLKLQGRGGGIQIPELGKTKTYIVLPPKKGKAHNRT